MEQQERTFLDKKDYKSYVIITIVFMISYCIGDAFGGLFQQGGFVVKIVFSAMGGVIGFALAKLLYKEPK